MSQLRFLEDLSKCIERQKRMTKKVSILGLILLWLLLTSAGPFMFILIPGHPHQFGSGAVLLVMMLFLLIKGKISIVDNILIFILSFQVCFFMTAALYHSDTSYISLSIRMVIIAIVYLFVATFIGVNKTAASVVNAMAIIGILGLIAFFGTVMGLMQPIAAYVKPNYDILYNYGFLTFSSLVVQIGEIQLIRASGFFEEPGALAYYLTHALIINKLLYDSKKIELILIISGIFTLSLALFVTLFFYYCFFYLKRKNYLSGLAVILIIGTLFIVLTNFREESQLLNMVSEMTFDRFALSDDGGAIIKGNNRVDSFSDGVQLFIEKPLMGHGFNKINNNFSDYNTASIFASIGIDGVIGLIFIFLHVIYLCFIVLSVKNSSHRIFLIKLIFLLLINYLQRPHVTEVFPYLIIILIISLIKSRYISNNLETHHKRSVISSPSGVKRLQAL